jgi:hypothetical protein
VLPGLGVFDAIFFDDFPLAPTPDEARYVEGANSRWHHFIDLCVSYHMRIGSRITGYLARGDIDLGRPDCTFLRSEFRMPIPADCPYAAEGEAFYVPILTLTDSPRPCGQVLCNRRGRADILLRSTRE